MPEPAVIVGPDERAAAANNPALELLPGLRVGDPFVLGLRAPDVIDARRRVMASGEAETVQWSERVPVERLFDVCVAPLATADGEVVATLITLRDQTEARRVERLRVDFIANASHELRTPLASLVGFIETLQGSAHDDAKARDRFLAIMREQGRRMARLIEDLLSLSRIEQKQHVRPETTVDLAQTTRSVVDALTPMAEDLGVEIRISAAQQVTVAGDRDELLRVAENLIENAIKYGVRAGSETAGVVEVAVTMNEKEGSLSVRDYGLRHCARAPAAADRAVLPRRRHPEPSQERHRPGPRDRKTHPHPPPRQTDDHQPREPGLLFCRGGAAAAENEAVILDFSARPAGAVVRARAAGRGPAGRRGSHGKRNRDRMPLAIRSSGIRSSPGRPAANGTSLLSAR